MKKMLTVTSAALHRERSIGLFNIEGNFRIIVNLSMYSEIYMDCSQQEEECVKYWCILNKLKKKMYSFTGRAGLFAAFFLAR